MLLIIAKDEREKSVGVFVVVKRLNTDTLILLIRDSILSSSKHVLA